MSIQKWCRAAALLTAATLLMGCSQTAQNTTPPKDALFCKSVSDNVQTVAQLHVTPGPSKQPTASRTICNYAKQTAMWFPVMDYSNTLTNQSEAEFTASMRAEFQNAANMGINTVYVHVRAYQDAYYRSKLFPLGSYCSDSCTYDPLAIMTDLAHEQNLSIHAWINPLRGQTDEEMQQMENSYLLKQWYLDDTKRGTYLVQVQNRWWLNPCYEEVRQLIADGAAEILTQYPVDGLHIDDYFYPTTDPSFDAAAFAASGSSDQTAWRLEQCSQLVQTLYDTVKNVHPDLLFGISPQGTIKGNLQHQFADVRRWSQEPGFCDYIVPQLYYGFQNESAPFSEMVTEWKQLVTCPDVSLVIGICTYKMGKEDTWAGSGSTEWQQDLTIPARQINLTCSDPELGGLAIYDYPSTFRPEPEVAAAMATQVQSITDVLQQEKESSHLRTPS